MNDDADTPLLCHRCGETLTSGSGNFYVVRIEAFADPTPPTFGAGDMFVDTDEEIADLLEEMKDMTEQELMDQVHRRMTIHLCRACYLDWIEDPTK